MMVDTDALRAEFAAALSAMYRREVPGYATLLGLVADANARAGGAGDARLAVERHGAIRVGRADELALLGRLFGLLGMSPVGYYDLAASGIPVHSTAFRPTAAAALARNPFRVFTSLLRLELIADPALRDEADAILARRRMVPDALVDAIARAEAAGGVEADAREMFVAEAVRVFRWRGEASVDAATYARLHAAHPLVADVVCFAGPHLNHLTPRVLHIDAVHRLMPEHGLAPKETIEGPPARRVPILLRQTSFKARPEEIRFQAVDGVAEMGAHTARFGEVESRGAALTPAGRALYDRLLAERALERFPDDWDRMRADGLVYARGGAPILYEDFLPASAAGIFRSNLDEAAAADADARAAGTRGALEAALGRPILDEFALYEAQADAVASHAG